MNTNPMDVHIYAVAMGALEHAPRGLFAPFRGTNRPHYVEDATNLWIADEAFGDSLGLPIRRSMFSERWPATKSISATWNTGPQRGGPLYMSVTLFTEAPYVRDTVKFLDGSPWTNFYPSRRAAEDAVERAWQANQPFGLFGKDQGTMTPEQLREIVPGEQLSVAIAFRHKERYYEGNDTGWCWINTKTGVVSHW